MYHLLDGLNRQLCQRPAEYPVFNTSPTFIQEKKRYIVYRGADWKEIDGPGGRDVKT